MAKLTKQERAITKVSWFICHGDKRTKQYRHVSDYLKMVNGQAQEEAMRKTVSEIIG